MKDIINNFNINSSTIIDPIINNNLRNRINNSIENIFSEMDNLYELYEIQPTVLLNTTYTDQLINQTIDITNYNSYRIVYDLINTSTTANVSGGLSFRYNNDSTASRYQGVQFNGGVATFGTSTITGGFGASYNEFKMEPTTANAVLNNGNYFHAEITGVTKINAYRTLFAKYSQKRGGTQQGIFGEWYYKYNSTTNAITSLNIYSAIRHSGKILVLGL